MDPGDRDPSESPSPRLCRLASSANVRCISNIVVIYDTPTPLSGSRLFSRSASDPTPKLLRFLPPTNSISLSSSKECIATADHSNNLMKIKQRGRGGNRDGIATRVVPSTS